MRRPKSFAALAAAALLALLSAASWAQDAPAPLPYAPRPADAWGALRIENGRIVSNAGAPVALRGMSLFWSQWDPGFYRAETAEFLAREWKCAVVRAALGVDPGGYLAKPAAEEAKVLAVVDAAISEGIYAIIDWHDHKASERTERAAEFFGRMAEKYRGVPNVIFEIYNEPLKNESWESVKAYAEEVIRAIRAKGNGNLVIVGSPSWSQDVDDAASDPLDPARFGNVAYALHFYAGTHKGWLRSRAISAMEEGIAIFVSEWGTCDASGNGGFDPDSSDDWLDFCDEYGLSWCNWSFNNKDETASALKRTARPGKSSWTDADLSPSGLYVRGRLLKAAAAK